MASTPSSGRSPPGAANTILPYRMHVSQRYLDLTRQKLGLTRLPREPQVRQQQWDWGVSKGLIEALVDHWGDEYDWRAQEAFYNDLLPQYRLAIHGTRLHFVHKRSAAPNAIPLLIAHAWPESFIAVANMIDALCNPPSTPRGNENAVSFHVVVPSIPGFGFSDQVPEEGNSISTSAEAFDALMKSLGYAQYIAHGSGWGFAICRMLALTHSESCMAVHATNPEVPPPRTRHFGYAPQEMAAGDTMMPLPIPDMSPPPLSPGAADGQSSRTRPQTISYALCDSPVGLLSVLLDAVQPSLPPPASPTSSSSSTSAPKPTSPGPSSGRLASHPWTLTTVIDWAMLYWLPGPEVALRWMAHSTPMLSNLWLTYSSVPLAVSQYGDHPHHPHHHHHNAMQPPPPPPPPPPGTQPTPLVVEAYHHIAMVRRRPHPSRFPAWERPMEVVQDLRDLAILVAPALFASFRAGVMVGME